MKKVQLLTLVTLIVAGLNSFADATMPKGPGITPKSTIDLDQVAQQIKNEKHASNTKSKVDQYFDQQLLEDLVSTLQHDDLVKSMDDKSLDNVLSFSALALQAWNPELKEAAIKTQIAKNIVHFGFMKGFVTPMMTLIDLSYATDKPQFGNLINVMLAEISPAVASGLEKNYGLPTSINGMTFSQLSNYGRDYMWKVLVSQVGSDLQNDFAQKGLSFDQTLNEKMDPMNYDDKSMDHFVSNTIKSKNAYLNQYFNLIGHGQTASGQGGLTNEAKKTNAEKIFSKRGIFTDALASEADSCLSKCMDVIGQKASSYGDKGETIGTVIGAAVGKVKKGGTAAGAAIGGLIGKGVGAAVGVVAGGYECSKSKECGASDADKETAAKEKKAKEQKEKELKEKAVKEQKEKLQKEVDENKKQQDEVKKQQDELKKQQEKNKGDQKRQEEIKKQQQELEKQQAELKKKEAELKKQQEDQRKADEEEKKQEEEKAKEEAEQQQTDQSKTMQKEDEGPHKTIEEQQKMKKASTSTPRTPVDDFSIAGVGVSKLDYIKAIKKEKNSSSSETHPGLVYPKSPNSAD